MMLNCFLRSPVHSFLATVILVAAVVLVFEGGNSVVEADEFPTFFLKAAKSVPRIGRRSGADDDLFFKKANHKIGRIGRRGGYASSPIKSAESLPWYSKQPAQFSRADDNEYWSAENVARALEQSPELWEMTTGDESGEDPTVAGKVWQREKRTGSEQAEM
ncbi:ecdysis triggering hormone [Neodiprion pinetum]|uniref:Uncharacterized protein LOC107221412 n=1 Tax=Neodiprion lecontei TaxID=441921 RepID=A0A6J0BMG0_NEOLC|nr:uncharacterized protein LOC107221412 [Neodiprion lecontei]XP_046420315.1 uncharacterized protein LOC124179689 [Neodiprion fabricii]XP_046477798.1 uncharacterized protein LOC124216828 [Neodiprion pinetum]XP_046617588.1 uncharacterized protein LOC124303866 [Neodiprion virginianus]